MAEGDIKRIKDYFGMSASDFMLGMALPQAIPKRQGRNQKGNPRRFPNILTYPSVGVGGPIRVVKSTPVDSKSIGSLRFHAAIEISAYCQ